MIAIQPHPEGQTGIIVAAIVLWSIVRGDDEDRILEFAGLFQMVDQAANMHVHSFQHTSIDLHPCGVENAVFVAEIAPVARSIRHRRQRCILRYQAERHGTLMPRLAQGVPAFIIDAVIISGEFRWCLDRYVDGLKAEKGEEGRISAGIAQILDHLVDDEFRRIELVRQLCSLAILVPRGVVIVRHVGFVLPIVGAGCVKGK